MFRFMKQVFVSAIMFFGYNLSRVNSLQCISISNQKCKVRPEIVNLNSQEPIFYPYSIRQVNVVVVVIIWMIPMQNYAFLILLKL